MKIITAFSKKEDGPMTDKKSRLGFLEVLDLSEVKQCLMNQVHGDHVVQVDADYIPEEADGLITNLKDYAFFVLVADCVPLIFKDEVSEVVGVAHTGRRGTLLNIASKMVRKIEEIFSADINNIIVDIGPLIGVCCYEVSVGDGGSLRLSLV